MRTAPLLFALLLAGAACRSARSPAPRPYVPDLGPPVSASCLAAARDRVLLDQVPASVGAYRVTRSGALGLHLRRDGRALTDVEGKAVFEGLRPTGMAAGHSALFSVHTCPDAPRASCLAFEMWLCQTSLEKLTEELDAALARAGARDGELAVEVTVLEARGPACGPSMSCTPKPHYSTRKAVYDADATRRPLGGGSGRCDRDGDCEGPGNACVAWYLWGGGDLLLYRQYERPTFCGCVQNACTWFDQP